MATKGKLTAKQQRFVEEYSIDFNATQAALRAGYSEKTCGAIGTENLAKPLIQEAITEMRRALSKKVEITRETLIAELEEARLIALSAETPQASAAVSATAAKAKLMGLDKVTIDHTSSDGTMTPSAIDKSLVEALINKLTD